MSYLPCTAGRVDRSEKGPDVVRKSGGHRADGMTVLRPTLNYESRICRLGLGLRPFRAFGGGLAAIAAGVP